MNQRGLGLVEAMVAAAIVGIGFIAVFSLTTSSTNVLMSSIDREKGNMISTMIFEDLLTDLSQIKTCPTTCNYNNMNFTTAASGSVNSYDQKQSKWFRVSNSMFGTATNNDVRLIEVSQIGATTKFVISVTIHSRDGSARNEFKRIVNAS